MVSLKIKDTKKNKGQIFSPEFIVTSILNYCDYNGSHILKKHIIDNSCGNGAFLKEVVRRYIENAQKEQISNREIKIDIERYIHGIEIDKKAFDSCIECLNLLTSKYGITEVKWDIYHTDALLCHQFDEKMDYVVGNPPYVRVHNLDTAYEAVKKYSFSNGGMTDLYLAFFELGFRMLNSTGQLCYITPSSWLHSLAATTMRKYIMQHKKLVALVDLGHYQAFENVTSYTIISHFQNTHTKNTFDYYSYNGDTHQREWIEKLHLQQIFINSYFYLGNSQQLEKLKKIKTTLIPKYVSVKNGFATLADAVFIGNHVPQTPITIKVLKGSIGKWYNCIFPYDKQGIPLSEKEVFQHKAVKDYLYPHKDKLIKKRKYDAAWYLFGRSQAIKDVHRSKLSVNSLIRSKYDLKITPLNAGEGVYSSLYIVTDYNIDFQIIKDIIISNEFVEYVHSLKKYKSGGYYTFNSTDIEQYINYMLTFHISK